MASLLPDFEYDIFISYRHNDNLPTGQAGLDGWVTDFVQNLEKELKGTLKDAITIYFDKSPHDGLLETHSVDKSLEGKLKCLIFIPIISQTYCDPKSFAWQHEFCAFNKMAKEDKIGRDIKLNNGNVTSRILPVKIHELDARDQNIFEHELGGPLRALEFIYKEPGVNRPLIPSDNKNDNQHKTDYRNQINKLANAIKAILNGIAFPNEEIKPHDPSKETSSRPPEDYHPEYPIRQFSRRRNFVIALTIAVALASLYFILKSPVQNKSMTEKSSILVLPFRVDTRDSSQQYFADGVTLDLITELAKIQNLSIFSWATTFNYLKTSKSPNEIAAETKAMYVLMGSIRSDGQRIRVNVQLVNPVNNQSVWTESFDREKQLILDIQKEIAANVANALRIRLSSNEKIRLETYQTRSFAAYDLFQQARLEFRKSAFSTEHFISAHRLLTQALTLDPEFAEALTLLAFVKIDLAWATDLDPAVLTIEAKQALQKALSINPDSPDAYIVLGGVNFFLEWKLEEAKKNLEKGWELSREGETPIYHCFCAYSEFTIAKGDYAGALSIIEKIQKNDPFYPYGEPERFMVYRMLNDRPAMNKILANPVHLDFVPMYNYDLGNYGESINSFLKLGTTENYPTTQLASAYYKAGRKHESDSLIQITIQQTGLKRNLNMGLAVAYAARGEKQEAIKWFKKAYQNHDFFIIMSKVDQDLKLIIDDPEVKQILRTLGLE